MWVSLLLHNLELATALSKCGREEFLRNTTVQLAAEALILRVGDLSKSLIASELDLSPDLALRQAARTRDFVAHHYHRVNLDVLWETLTTSLTDLEADLRSLDKQQSKSSINQPEKRQGDEE
jgi:uncharacterized protein with HEPN domain